MKKLIPFVAALGLAVAAHSQIAIKGIGYDVVLNNVVVRLGGIGPNAALDVGGAVNYDGSLPSDNLALGLSAFYLGHLQHWGPVDNYFAAGGIFNKPLGGADNTVALLGGLQPEVTVLEHIALSTRFGFLVPLSPDFKINTQGSGVSIVGAAAFKILF
ncbi:MAG TPA: hypothetical protein DCQ83_03890 [Fibrobacteres bacterium]|jgi:hypothetical protein|nr:hypothetical protein [Fibrobacterota bacterium]